MSRPQIASKQAMPSLSKVERGDPPPRRKSCAVCIKAKRRCDLGLPACLRCTQRKLDCRYPAGRTSRPESTRTPAASGARHPRGPDVGTLTHEQRVPGDYTVFFHEMQAQVCTTQGFNTLPTTTAATTTWVDAQTLSAIPELDPTMFLSGPDMLVPPSAGFDMLDYPLDSEPGANNSDTTAARPDSFNPSTSPSPRVPVVVTTTRELVQQASFSAPVDCGLVRPKGSYDSFSRIIATRLQYSLDRILEAPQQMVLENETPWCHPHLYRESMPRCMEGKRLSSYEPVSP
jgi:hypothetical protein